MKKLTERFLCTILTIAILVSLCSYTVIVSAAADGCKIVDILFSKVFTENLPNTMNITVGSLNYSGGFKLEVYEGGKERQKIFEGSGSVNGFDWSADTYGSTVVSVPLTAHPRGIVPYEIYLTPDNGGTVLNRAVYRVFGKDEIINGLMITDNADSYVRMRELLKQKGVNVIVASAPNDEQVRNAGLIITGTAELNKMSAGLLEKVKPKNLLLFKNGEDTEKTNAYLADIGSGLRISDKLASEDIKSQEYGNCSNYRIIDPDLDKDTQIKNMFFHIKNGSAIEVKTDDNTESVVMADGSHPALMAEVLSGSCKIAVAGSDFVSDAELEFSADSMYEQLFSKETYEPESMRVSSNYNVSANLLDWLLPQSDYKDVDISELKTGSSMQGSFVSVTGTVVTPSEAISQNGTAFENYIYLQDETDGIRIYGINRDVNYCYQTWKLNVKGYVSSYGGEREIVVYDQFKDLTVVSRKDHAPEPQSIKASEVSGSRMTGNLVRITGKVSGESAGSLTVSDSSGETSVFIDSYIGSSLGSWGQGQYDPRIEYGCTVEVTGIVSVQNGRNVIRIYDTANILLKLDKNGAAVEPPSKKISRRFGGGLVELTENDDTTVTIGNEQKEMTKYMKLLVDLKIIDAAAMPDKELPVSNAFPKIMNGLKLTERKNGYDTSVKGAALRLLSALGYDYFFTGEKKTANETRIIHESGILEGITAEQDSLLTTQDAARMVYNAFLIPYFGSSSYSPGGNTYHKLNTCILDNLRLTQAEGVITQTHYTDINSSLPENVVKMSFRASKLSDNGNLTKTSGEELFYSDIPDIDRWLARRIEVFVLDDSDNDRNIIAVLPEEHSTVYRLPQEDYVEFKDGKISHIDEKSKIRNLSVSNDARLYVNGVYSGAVNAESLSKPYISENTLAYLYGWYTLIDNNGDGSIESVLAEVYRDCIVGSMDKQTFRIDNKLSDVPQSIFLNPEYDNDFHVAYVKSTGEAAAFSDIEKGDVLSIAEAKTDGRNIVWAKVVITKGSIKGKISSINKSEMQLELNGKWYDYIEIDDLRQDDFLFSIGDEGKFFVNMQGIVIVKDLKSMPYQNYAFVLAFGIVDSGFDEIPAMCVYLPQGGWTSYYFAKNVTVRDGGFSETLKRDALVEKYLTDMNGDLTLNTRTLVNFELNDNGEIRTISFPFNNATGKNDKGRLTLDRKYNQPEGDNIPEINETFKYDKALKCIGDAFLTENTVIFDISLSGDETVQNVDDIKNRISVIPVSMLRDGSAPAISLFDMGDGNECAAAVTINAARAGTVTENLFIVNNTALELDEYGDDVTVLYGYEKGEQKRMVLDDDVSIRNFMSGRTEELGSGDLILYSQNIRGLVTDISIVINVAMAENYLPDVYGDGSLILSKVNFYSDASNPKQVVNYYYGLVTEKYQNKLFGKLVLARDNTVYPTTLLERMSFAPMIVTDDQTVFYRINQRNRHPVQKSDFADVITSPSGNFITRKGDLAVVKTVNNIATDVILISPDL